MCIGPIRFTSNAPLVRICLSWPWLSAVWTELMLYRRSVKLAPVTVRKHCVGLHCVFRFIGCLSAGSGFSVQCSCSHFRNAENSCRWEAAMKVWCSHQTAGTLGLGIANSSYMCLVKANSSCVGLGISNNSYGLRIANNSYVNLWIPNNSYMCMGIANNSYMRLGIANNSYICLRIASNSYI
jgi:hypothetical protein